MPQLTPTKSTIGSEDSGKPSLGLLWDRQGCIPLSKVLSEDDIILLLTPVVVPLNPESAGSKDPFEPLGLGVSRRHPKVRHVPYTKRHGITGVHVAFIRRAKAVIFVMTSIQEYDGVSQPALAEMVEEVCDPRPLIMVTCCEARRRELEDLSFLTMIQTPEFSQQDLESITSILVDGDSTRSVPSSPPAREPQESLSNGITWMIQRWVHDRDLADAHDLWLSTVPKQFYLDLATWTSLTKRDGYGTHRVVRHPHTKELVGFSLIYTACAYKSYDQVVRSIAAIVVREEYRNRGVGRLLHDEATRNIDMGTPVSHIQLGSTFPRFLYGVPNKSAEADWFQKRGWTISESTPGKGRVVSDWMLRFSDMPVSNLASAGLNFRPYEMTDYAQVDSMVTKESERKLGFGWYEQYARLLDSSYMDDVLLGFEGTTLVATAITYVPNSGNPIAAELPWASSVGPDMGGVTCICIKDDDPEMVNRRDTVMVRLLHGCCKLLHEKGMAGMFIDGVKHGDAGFESLGFRKWAEYREVWRTM